uniref:BLL11 n=1 Tax=Spodoptera exigua TaxID=7107 RepID=A0A3G1HH50_SPOEX|nr:BLL11 [Spodoptera exigua]
MMKLIYLMLLPMVLAKSYERKEFVQKFTFHRIPATFDEAKRICKQEGGNLAVVTSREAENEMLALWKRSGPVVNPSHGLNAQAFIGIQLTSKGWQTTFGDRPPYLNWSLNWWGRRQPDSPTIQKCGSLLKQGGMDDVHCYYKLAFFCENWKAQNTDRHNFSNRYSLLFYLKANIYNVIHLYTCICH